MRDRLSFTRFVGLGIEDGIPDGTTLWLFREKLAKAGLIDKLFERFGRHLEAKGYIARGGQMVDATIVAVPRQRNSRDENELVKAGTTPENWKKRPSKNRQKDKDARWTKKHGRSFFGYKNHVNADARHKLIRDYTVSDASEHDSQKLDELVNRGNTSRDVYPQCRHVSSSLPLSHRAIEPVYSCLLLTARIWISAEPRSKTMGAHGAAPIKKPPLQVACLHSRAFSTPELRQRRKASAGRE